LQARCHAARAAIASKLLDPAKETSLNIAVLGIKTIPAVAGADRVVEQLLEHFSPNNHYWVYLRADTAVARPEQRNIHFVSLPALTGKHLGSFTFFLICSLHYLCQKHYDLAHVHNSDFGLFMPLLRLKRAVPVLGTFHGDPYTRRKWGAFARAFLRLSERCFVQCCNRLTSVSQFKSVGNGVLTRRPIDYVPNGVNVESDDGDGDPLLTSLRLRPRSFILFACGRLDPTKGLHHLLDAYEQADPAERLLILGDFAHDPDYSRAIEQRIATRYGDSPERVCVVRELLPRARLLRVLRACKLFVFPSEYEAMSMMLLEAVSSRAPIVCSDLPENLAVLGADYPYAYPASDAGALAATVERALSDSDWPHRTEELYTRCVRDFSWAAVARRYEEIYDELSAAPRKAAGVRAPSTSS
jgi:glycosyltransferase involved in cell wall biosynthesis